MSKNLEQVLQEICKEAANPTEALYPSHYKAIDSLLDKNLEYTIYEEPLSSLKVNHFLGEEMSAHVIVGFRAITDVSFRVRARTAAVNIEYQVQMRAGEFQLAWRNKAPIILSHCGKRIEFTLTDVRGQVNMIAAFLDSHYRLEHEKSDGMTLAV